MKSTNIAYAVVAAILVAVAAGSPALAAIDSYVLATGSDSNNCSVSAPCQTMAHAISVTNPSGVLHCLDSNDYFILTPITITQSITIDCFNTTAIGPSFIINGTGVTVHIKGLTMTGSAITFQNGFALYVENCLMFEGNTAIQFEPSAAASLFIVNSTIRNNEAGVLIKPAAGGSATATFDGVAITNNSGGGVKTDTTNGPVSVDISNSTISNNAGNGMNAVSGASGQNNMLNLSHNVIAGNGSAGVQVNGNHSAALIDTTLLDSNTAGALSAIGGGRALTYGNNRIVGSSGTGFTGPATLQ
jgi:hypothetical protein